MTADKIYVRTVYAEHSYQEPNISSYDSEKEAKDFIDTCLKWGIGIVSCEITSKEIKNEFMALNQIKDTKI